MKSQKNVEDTYGWLLSRDGTSICSDEGSDNEIQHGDGDGDSTQNQRQIRSSAMPRQGVGTGLIFIITARDTRRRSPGGQAEMPGGIAVRGNASRGSGAPYVHAGSSSASSTHAAPPQSSTYTPTPAAVSSGRQRTSPRPSAVRRAAPRTSRSNWTLCSAAMRSAASGVAFGGSSLTGAQPIGGEPGGDMRKFFVGDGGARWCGSRVAGSGGVDASGVGSPRKTRRVVRGLGGARSVSVRVGHEGGGRTH